MITGAPIEDLWASAHGAREAGLAAQRTVDEDVPEGEATLAVERLSDGVTDVLGWLEEILAALGPVVGADAARPSDVAAALEAVDERLAPLAERLDEITRCDRMAEVARLAERHPLWARWVHATTDATGELTLAARALDHSLHSCWRELVAACAR